MGQKLIYIDTSIWNRLSDQRTIARDLSDALAHDGLQLVLGQNVFFEALKTFQGARKGSETKARALFQTIHSFLLMGTPVLRTWEEYLMDEARDASGLQTQVGLFCDGKLGAEILKVSSGLSKRKLSPYAEDHLRKRKVEVERVRTAALEKIESQPEFKSDLQSIAHSEIDLILDRESVSRSGQDLLALYLRQVLKDQLPSDAQSLAAAMLASPRYLVAHALVRSDMYHNWRGARTGAIARSKPDDCYHVVNASYCSYFVTADRDGQAAEAEHSVKGIRAREYAEAEGSLQDWLPKFTARGLGKLVGLS